MTLYSFPLDREQLMGKHMVVVALAIFVITQALNSHWS